MWLQNIVHAKLSDNWFNFVRFSISIAWVWPRFSLYKNVHLFVPSWFWTSFYVKLPPCNLVPSLNPSLSMSTICYPCCSYLLYLLLLIGLSDRINHFFNISFTQPEPNWSPILMCVSFFSEATDIGEHLFSHFFSWELFSRRPGDLLCQVKLVVSRTCDKLKLVDIFVVCNVLYV